MSLTLVAALLLFLAGELTAQRNVEYRQLLAQKKQDPVSVSLIKLPGESDSTVTMAATIGLPYSFLPFKKATGQNAKGEFYSTTELSMEVFKSDRSKIGKDDISVKGLEPVARSFWSDTAYAGNYEQSQSRSRFLTGYLEASVKPGIYSYILQMRRGQETNNRISRARTVRMESYGDMNVGNVILGSELSDDWLTLSPLAGNVKYAENFYALAYIPAYDSGANYTLEITNLNVVDEDTSRVSTVYTKELGNSEIRTGLRPALSTAPGEQTHLELDSSGDGYAYALLEVPNRQFPNALYRFRIMKEGSSKPVSQTTYRSIWIDIPASLLSLDVAIDMLRYIADEKTIDRLSTGTQREREQKFRAFWEKRDPTPDTEFNELMAEYYRRVDYAYDNFTTNNNLGFNSDQGEVYIKFGPPQDIERKFPTNGATTEIWTYPSRTFVFKATTGFGDFRLVSREKK